jgi:hypothetical protein
MKIFATFIVKTPEYSKLYARKNVINVFLLREKNFGLTRRLSKLLKFNISGQ